MAAARLGEMLVKAKIITEDQLKQALEEQSKSGGHGYPLKKNDGKITFMNLQPQIKKVFEIINALPSMRIFSSIQELDDYLDVMQKKAVSAED